MNHIHPHIEDHLAERVLHRIEDEHLTPRPRWEFLLKNYVFWTFGVFAVILGALAVSASFFEITNVDWRLGSATHPDFVSFFLAAAPVFWVVTLILFLLIGYINVRHTNHGYRYSLWVIALGAVMMSLTLGSGIYAVGFGRMVEEVVGDHPPFYRPIVAAQESWWLAPEKGLLGGKVVQVASNMTSFVVDDFTGHTWQVDSSDLRSRDLITVARGGEVRIVGAPTATSSTAFHACFVFPWKEHNDGDTDVPPRPLATISSTTERNTMATRSEICKGIHPYQQLRSINKEGL